MRGFLRGGECGPCRFPSQVPEADCEPGGRKARPIRADPLFAQYGMLKVGDLYRQPLRVHAWWFQFGLLPNGQVAMLTRTADMHGYATRSAHSGLTGMARDHRMVGYRVPKEWATLTEAQRGVWSLAALKRGARAGFLAEYGPFVCQDDGCWVCGD